jgi:NitT/TauT family transport system substrate-binding protein
LAATVLALLTIKTQFAAGGAAIVPAAMSGDQQIGWSNTTSTLLAATRLPIRVIAPGAQTGTGDEDISSLVVPRDSPIREPEDLEGKTLAVNTLKNISEITTRAALEKARVDLGKVKFVEVPFPDVPPATRSRRVDAAFVVEPFRTRVLGQGARELLKPFSEAAEGERLQTTEWFTCGLSRVESRGSPALRQGHRAGQRVCCREPRRGPGALLKYTETPPAVAKRIRLPVWSRDIDRDSVEIQRDLLERYGWIRERPDLQELYPGIKTRSDAPASEE